MASLTRGISFRRQGSSGMCWTDSWAVNDDSVLARKPREENPLHAGGSLSRVHDSQDADPAPSNPAPSNSAPSVLGRSKSTGSVPTSHGGNSSQKSGFRLVKWFKKAFKKLRT